MRSNFIEITLLHGCSLVNLPYFFRSVSHKITSRGLLLNIVTNKRGKGDKKIQCNRNYVYSLFDIFISFLYCSYSTIQKYNGYIGWVLEISNQRQDILLTRRDYGAFVWTRIIALKILSTKSMVKKRKELHVQSTSFSCF